MLVEKMASSGNQKRLSEWISPVARRRDRYLSRETGEVRGRFLSDLFVGGLEVVQHSPAASQGVRVVDIVRIERFLDTSFGLAQMSQRVFVQISWGFKDSFDLLLNLA